MNKSKKEKRIIVILSTIFVALILGFVGMTLAWFTDTADFSSSIGFGTLNIDTTSGESTQSVLTHDVLRNIGAYNNKLMPGDTVTFNLRLHLSSNSEPAYYLVKMNGIGRLATLTSDTFYYLDNTLQIADDDNQTVGEITSAETLTLALPYVIPTSYTSQGGSGKLFCDVYAIQQVNLTKAQAYELLVEMATPAPITAAAIQTYKTTATKMGFYKESAVPSGYTLDSTKTATLQTTLGATDIQVYSKNSTEIAFVSKKEIGAPADCTSLFQQFSALTELDLTNFNTTNTTIMRNMLRQCSNLTSINLSTLDTKNVTDMFSMFVYCSKLTSLNLNYLNTSQVTDMAQMFAACPLLTSLDLKSFDTSRVTTMKSMFQQCTALQNLDLKSFDTSGVTTMRSMFQQCTALQNVDLKSFDTSSVTTMESMFARCTALQNVDLTNFNTERVSSFEAMFYDDTNLNSIYGLENLDFSEATSMPGMFQECSALTSITLANCTLNHNLDARNAFFQCTSLKNVDLQALTFLGEANFAASFSGCSQLQTVTLPNSLKYIGKTMFQFCSNLRSVNIPTSTLWIGDFAFNHCSSLNWSEITIPASVVQIGGDSYTGTTQTLGTHVFYNCATNNLQRFNSLSPNFVTDSTGALYTAGYRYLVAYPSANPATSYTMHSGCIDCFEMAFSRSMYLTDLTINDELVIYKTNTHTSNYVNYSNSLNLATYCYTSIRNYHVLPSNTTYIEEDGIIYKAINNDPNNLELIAIGNSKALENNSKIITISEKCTQVDCIPIMIASSDTTRMPSKIVLLNANCVVTTAVKTGNYITSGAGVVEGGKTYIYVDGTSPYPKVEVQFGA